MDENVLRARIIGDVSGLKKAMGEGKDALEGFTQAQRDALDYAKKLKEANDQAERTYAGLSKSTGATTVVFQEFNRVIQDAPFGMIGVGNNLQQLASNFGAAATKAGGAGAAFKEAFRSLGVGLNPAILAVSLITTGITLYQREAQKAEKETNSFADALESFKNSLNSVQRANLDGAAAADKEASKFNLLRAQAENANIPLKERIEAVDQLQKDYPRYLENLTKEQILAGDVGDAYDDLTKSIIATAKAKAFADEITKNSIKLREIELRTTERASEILAARDRAEQARRNNQNPGARVAGQFTAIDNTAEQAANETIKRLIEEQLADVNEINKLKVDSLGLEKEITKEIEAGARFTKQRKLDTKEDIEAFKEFSKAQTEVNRIFFRDGKEAYEAMQDQLKATIEEADKLDKLAKSIVDTFAKTDHKGKIIDDPFGISASLAKMGPPVKEEAKMYDPSDDLDRIAEKAKMTEAAFDGLGAAISMAFGSGNEWGRFLGGFVKFAGMVIAQNFAMAQSGMINNSIMTGGSFGPAAAFATPGIIASGLALLGSLFAAIKSGGSASSAGGSSMAKALSYGGLPRREKGGQVNAGQAYIVGEKRAEVFVPNVSGMILPSVSDFASNTTMSAKKSSSTITVEVFGVLENEVITLSNKRGARKISKT